MLLLARPFVTPPTAIAAEGDKEYPEAVKAYMAALDTFLAAHAYLALANKIRKPDPVELTPAALDWAKRKVLAGDSLIVTLLYSELLWTIGNGVLLDDPLRVYKESAGLVALYAFAVSLTDGVKCADPTAPNHRMNVITHTYREPFRVLANLPPGQRQTYIRAVVEMEVRISPQRKDDNYLCRFGVQETKDSLDKYGDEGLKDRPPGSSGQIEVPSDPAYEPKYLPPEAWELKQAEIRTKLPELLAALIEKYRDAPPPEKDTQPAEQAPDSPKPQSE